MKSHSFIYYTTFSFKKEALCENFLKIFLFFPEYLI